MGAYIIYSIKVALALGVMSGFYRMLLKNETFHRTNRMALLGILLFSWLVPMIEFEVTSPNVVQQTWSLWESSVIELPEVVVMAAGEPARQWGVLDCVLLIYLLGVGVRLVQLLWSYVKIRQVFGRGYALDHQGRKVIVGDNSVNSFSFGRTIYLQSDDYAHHFEEVFAHENGHVSCRHTVDLLVMECVGALQWFNPVVYLLKQSLVDVHEFEADRWALAQGVDSKVYQRLLIEKSIGVNNIILANSLNQSSIKKRVIMMLKKKSSYWASLKLVGIFPAAFVCISLFANPIEEGVQTVNESKEKGGYTFTLGQEKSEKAGVGDNKITGTVVTAMGPKKNGTIKLDKSETGKIEGIITYAYARIDDGKSGNKTTSTSKIKVTKKDNSTQSEGEDVFTIVETMPEYPGGMTALKKFLSENIKYPTDALEKGISGRVYCQFVIGKDGRITDAKVIKSVDELLDKEALRVINAMPKWVPGKQKGKAVRVQYTLPITFALQ